MRFFLLDGGGGEGFCFCCFCKAKTAVGRVELVVVFLFKVCFGSSNRWCVCVYSFLFASCEI